MTTHNELRLPKSKSRLRLAVIQTIESNRLLMNTKSILLGFSGGVDSSVLFDVLLSLREKYSFTLYAVHVNHCIRGEEADRDEEFVRGICEVNGIKCFVVKEDVPKIASSSGKSVELAAREIRYKAFERITSEYSIDAVATAHNADDNAETLLYNIIRGTGINGLCGIPYRRENIIRPLRDVTRKDIDSYASYYGIKHMVDSTNLIPDCTRNKLRLEIIPKIKEINPSFASTANIESKIMSQIKEFVSDAAQNADEDISECNDAIIYNRIYSVCGSDLRLEQAEKMKNAIKEKKKRVFSFSEYESAETENGRLYLKAKVTEERIENEYIPLKFGKNILRNNACVFVSDSENFNDIYNFTTTVRLCSAKIQNGLYIRYREIGDKLKIKGMTKYVKKEFINKKIPLAVRNKIPLICTENKIVAVPFIGVADEFRYTKGECCYYSFGFPFEINN